MEAVPAGAAGESRAHVLTRIAGEAGAQAIAQEALALAARIREGLFYVACVGQFKRGKSSLLNALVADPVLPVGVIPVTTVVTIVRYGAQRAARVRLAGGTWRDIDVEALAEYVTEEKNPENGKGVAAVEVFTPSPLLASGMCLVDTPGIGSVFAGNTEATRAFVPHVDAALVVLGADPPISADELALIEEIAKQCTDLLFVLNKADKLPKSERDEAVDFTRQILSARLGKDDAPVFEVSATERLAGQGPERRWADLTAALERLAHESGSDLVRAAEDRGLALLAERLRRCLEEERGALLRPIEESERRIAALLRVATILVRDINDAVDLLLKPKRLVASLRL
jgi:ribosome biogenesis GTPase A